VKIVVPIKQVPDTETKVVIGADGKSMDASNANLVVNPYDEYALEEALKIKEAKGGGEVIALTIGPDSAVQALRTCLAVGADRAVHVKENADALDSLALSRLLAAAIKDLQADLVLTGKYAVGTDNQAAPVMLAEHLGWPHVTVVTKLEVGDGKVKGEREIEGALEVFEASIPCVITAQKGLNEPRYASLKGIMMAKKKPVDSKTPADYGLDAASLQPKVTWEKLELPPGKSAGKKIPAEDDPAGAARELVRLLHEEAKII